MIISCLPVEIIIFKLKHPPTRLHIRIYIQLCELVENWARGTQLFSRRCLKHPPTMCTVVDGLM